MPDNDTLPNGTALTLGERLAQNDALRQRAITDADAARKLRMTQQERQQFELVEMFFRHVKEALSQAIIDGQDSRSIYAQVGGRRHGKPLYRANDETERVLGHYQYDQKGMVSLQPRGRFSALWVEFQNWAASQGLEAVWQNEHDGVGMESWFSLYLRPRKAT